jgi:Lar family restriction alleviation protein
MRELKPCPFCGGEDIACVIALSYVEIHCRNCKATITRGVMGKYDCLADSEEEIKPVAVKAWNTRTIEKGGAE